MQADQVESPESRIVAFAMRNGVTMTTQFVPWSQSRNKAEKHPSLNWLVTLTVGEGRPILTTDYMAGSGHCPSYKASKRHLGHANSLTRFEAIKHECETGRGDGKKLQPKISDVLYSLAMDASVLDSGSFEDWAVEFGYETDSRKAEAIYHACLDIALKLRNGLGEAKLAELREACQDY